MSKKKKFGIALGSGGARGVAHLGFLQVLDENGIRPDCISGASMGAIVGALYCTGVPYEKILPKVEQLRQSQIMNFDVLFFKNRGLLKNTKVLSILNELLGEKSFKDLKIPFCCSALDLVTGKTICLNSGSLKVAAMASAAVPGVFQPVEIGKAVCVDGGTINKVPVDMCRSMGADIVLGVDVLGDVEEREAPKNLIDTIERAFIIMNYHTGLTERDNADKLVVLKQSEIDPARAEKLMTSYEIGRKAAEDNLDEIRAMSEGEYEPSADKKE